MIVQWASEGEGPSDNPHLRCTLQVSTPPGESRAEVMQVVDIFRARVTDVSERSLTICLTGDPGKVSKAHAQGGGRGGWLRLRLMLSRMAHGAMHRLH